MASIDIKVPDIGDFKDVAVIEVLVKPGDTIKAEQSLITVESDKASMEIPSSHAGTVKELKVKLGDTVNQGTVILALDAAGASAMTPAAAPSAGAPAPVPAPHSARQRRPLPRATPAVPTSSATCSCLARGPAAIRRLSGPPISG
jgi:pyruvate/2-oxoglutarate dehydrogenase complex dihydrolipoamide acyltransferase (E2) component